MDARRRFAVGLALGAAMGFAGCLASRGGLPGAVDGSQGGGRALASNVLRSDYAGSRACEGCHHEIAAAWERSPMHRMTRDAKGAEVRAPFDGRTFTFREDTAHFDTRGGERFLRIEPKGSKAFTYRITRVIGGRTREDFAGVDVSEGAPAEGAEEHVLPVSYVFATAAFRYKGYSVMLHERTGLHAGPVWSRTCIFCHNTVPELDRLLGTVAGPARANAYQGESVERWLPEGRRARYAITDEAGFRAAAQAEAAHLGGALRPEERGAAATARQAIEVVRSRFDGASLVEVGIGCEACHGGAAAHAANPRVRPSFTPTAPWLETAFPSTPDPGTAPASGSPAHASAINRVCARCHQVLFSGYPFTWEGGRRNGNAGGSHINSGEARDFLLGGCAGAMACTSCHDPHGGDDASKRAALATPAGNVTCTACHRELASPLSLKAHAHHDPNGAGGACVACHLPRKNMGLDGTLTRYHRIGSPTDPERVLADRPIECALCHADARVGKLAETLEAWWPVKYPRQGLVELYGSLDANVLRATLERGKPHEQAVAMSTLAEAHERDAAPAIGAQLLSDYPLVREWSKRALTTLLGPCELDVTAREATLRAQAAACLGQPLTSKPRASADPAPGARDAPPED